MARPPTPPPLHDLTPEELRAVFEQLDREEGLEIDYDELPIVDVGDDQENHEVPIEDDVHGAWLGLSGEEIERMLDDDAYVSDDAEDADAPAPPRGDFSSVRLNLRMGMRA